MYATIWVWPRLQVKFELFAHLLVPLGSGTKGNCRNLGQVYRRRSDKRHELVVMLEPTSFPSLSFRFPNGMLTLQRVAARRTKCVCSKKQSRVYRQLGLGIVNVEHVVHAMHGEYKRRAWSLTMIIPQPDFRLQVVLTTLKINQWDKITTLPSNGIRQHRWIISGHENAHAVHGLYE